MKLEWDDTLIDGSRAVYSYLCLVIL